MEVFLVYLGNGKKKSTDSIYATHTCARGGDVSGKDEEGDIIGKEEEDAMKRPTALFNVVICSLSSS